MDKEQIIIDGVFINACLVPEKCKEFETCKIKNILRQLARKTQECEKLRIKLDYYIEKTKQLLDDLDNKDRFNSELQQECEELKDTLRTLTRGVVLPTPEPEVIDLTDRYRKALAPFQDEYFKGLDTTAIAELAKKSIRLTTENRKLETALDEIEEMLQVIVKSNKVYPLQSNLYKILNIISKAKGEENAR